MTISGTATDIVVDGDGLTTVFSYDFYMGGSSAYAVLVFTDTDGTQTTVAAADFTITGVTVQTGGTFTYPLVGSPIATGTTLTLSRVLPLVQNAAVGNQSNFYPSVVEGALDYQMMVAQQISGGAAGTIDAASLFGNSGASSGAGTSIPIGSGLSFSGNTLVVSGISGSGTVTSVATGDGLTGGPVTGVGTISLSSITASSLLANPLTTSAAPTSVVLGAGLTFSGTTLVISGFVKIATITASVVTASFTFSSIVSTYNDLIVMLTSRSATTSTSDPVLLRLNGDTGSNYNSQRTNANLTTNNAAESILSGSFLLSDITGAGGSANYAGQMEITFPRYAANVFNKTCRSTGGFGRSDASGNTFVQGSFGLWKSTASITSVTILTSSGAGFVTGSTAVLYARG